MQQNKNILIINDMPGYGKVALAAMLPILSHMGHNIYNLPTALVSNTLDYGKFTILDTTDYMKKSIAVWKELGFSFDCITTGFLASAEQVDIIRAFIESQRKEDLLVMTDPIGVADVIVPNLTEAEFLTERYRGAEALDRHQAREVVDALLACGPRSVVITSGLEAETGRHVVWGYCHRQGRYFTLPFDFIQVHFPGTGDVFSAVLIGELLAGTGLEQAAQKAMDTVERLVCLDRNEVEKNKGIRIERFLKELDL
jgi:pyridoxine kinase